MALAVVVEQDPPIADPVLALAQQAMAAFAAAAFDHTPVDDAARIDRIAALEELRRGTAGLQAVETVRFARSQVAQQMEADTDPRLVGRGIADQVALARKISPVAGARWLSDARDLCLELPHTFRALVIGTLAERVAVTVVRETRHLDSATRGRLDADLADRDLGAIGVKAAEATIRAAAYRADPAGYVARGRTERKHRRVTLRPAPDTMALLTGYLPVEQGVACYAALKQHTDARVAAGDDRSRGQIMADTFVQRLTGQAAATDVPIELCITMPLDVLTRTGRAKAAVAHLSGGGPLPMDLAREIITDSTAGKWWRRPFTAPATGTLVGGDPRRRRFDGFLADLIKIRDQHCRTPFCDAPVRELDHIERWTDGGLTTYRNGRAVCTRCNLTREAPGWSVRTVSIDHPAAAHTVATMTPTGHAYHSRAPNPP